MMNEEWAEMRNEEPFDSLRSLPSRSVGTWQGVVRNVD